MPENWKKITVIYKLLTTYLLLWQITAFFCFPAHGFTLHNIYSKSGHLETFSSFILDKRVMKCKHSFTHNS